MTSPRIFAISAIVIAGISTRLFPETLNFTAVGAACLFAGTYFRRRWMAVFLPLVAYLATDVVITVQQPLSHETNEWIAIVATYFLLAATAGLGMLIRRQVTPFYVSGVALVATGMFFLVSNFFVWSGTTMYSHDGRGLVTCYLAALPFAWNMLLGNLFFSAVLFGGWHLVEMRWPDFASDPAEKLAAKPVLP